MGECGLADLFLIWQSTLSFLHVKCTIKTAEQQVLQLPFKPLEAKPIRTRLDGSCGHLVWCVYIHQNSFNNEGLSNMRIEWPLDNRLYAYRKKGGNCGCTNFLRLSWPSISTTVSCTSLWNCTQVVFLLWESLTQDCPNIPWPKGFPQSLYMAKFTCVTEWPPWPT